MKTEEELKEVITSSKQELLNAIDNLKRAIEENDWEEVIQYANGFVVGACSINLAEGYLS